MSNREELQELLAQNGIDKTPEEVYQECLQSDTLAPVVGIAEDAEEAFGVIVKYLPSYVEYAEQGVVDIPTQQDPTQTEETKKAGKAEKLGTPFNSNLGAQGCDVIVSYVQSDHETREMVSAHSMVTKILTDKEHPKTFVTVKEVTTKGDPSTLADELKKKRQPSASASDLLVKGTSFIPTDKQLAELVTLWKGARADREGKTPAWSNIQADAAYAAVEKVLTDGKGTFKPFIAPDADAGEAAVKESMGGAEVKPWRPTVKGVVIRTEATAVGESSNVEIPLNKTGIEDWLLIKSAGRIAENPDLDGVSITMARRQRKARAATLSGKEEIVAYPKIIGAAKVGKKDRVTIKEKTQEKESMLLRSEMWYPICVVSKESASIFNVRKQRVALKWADGPKFVIKPEYEDLFAAKSPNGKLMADRKAESARALTQAIINKVAQGDTFGESPEMTEMLNKMKESMHKKTMEQADSMAL